MQYRPMPGWMVKDEAVAQTLAQYFINDGALSDRVASAVEQLLSHMQIDGGLNVATEERGSTAQETDAGERVPEGRDTRMANDDRRGEGGGNKRGQVVDVREEPSSSRPAPRTPAPESQNAKNPTTVARLREAANKALGRGGSRTAPTALEERGLLHLLENDAEIPAAIREDVAGAQGFFHDGAAYLVAGSDALRAFGVTDRRRHHNSKQGIRQFCASNSSFQVHMLIGCRRLADCPH
ncbi:hypothetical protein AGMMS50225_00990 [Betaproteobacteria bacterium]|nr:hypothetical protein AGMMS50225_00990 [Betaproteobacteria bacterium]